MPDQTRDVLKRLAESMRRAGGVQATPASTTPDGGDAPKVRPPEPKSKGGPGAARGGAGRRGPAALSGEA